MAKEDICVECGEYKAIYAKGKCSKCYSRSYQKKKYQKYRDKILERNRKWREENKEVKAEYYKEWSEKNKEARAKYNREWNEKNREVRREYDREFAKSNRERQKERNREYYEKNREKVLAANKLWAENNKERSKEITTNGRHRRRARIKGVKSETVSSLKVFERDSWKCGICGKRVNKRLKYPDPLSPSLDHIIPLSKNGTHTYDNVQLAHLRCNLRKSDKIDFTL